MGNFSYISLPEHIAQKNSIKDVVQDNQDAFGLDNKYDYVEPVEVAEEAVIEDYD